MIQSERGAPRQCESDAGVNADLLAAVMAMLAYGDSKFPENKAVAVNMALAAIAKAEGRQTPA